MRLLGVYTRRLVRTYIEILQHLPEQSTHYYLYNINTAIRQYKEHVDLKLDIDMENLHSAILRKNLIYCVFNLLNKFRIKNKYPVAYIQRITCSIVIINRPIMSNIFKILEDINLPADVMQYYIIPMSLVQISLLRPKGCMHKRFNLRKK